MAALRLRGVGARDRLQRKIAAVEKSISAADAGKVVDVTGLYVTPGLIDIHTHAGRYPEGAGLMLQDGVTGWIDAGSQGADRIGETIANARSSPQQGRVPINIGRAGILPEGDTMDLKRADVDAARAAIAQNRGGMQTLSSVQRLSGVQRLSSV